MNHGVRELMFAERTDGQPGNTYPFLITFSGIDGAGKTTQIEHLSALLQKQGLRVLRLSFWDDVAVWQQVRAGVGGRAADFYYPGRADEGSFVPKNHKHIRKWYLTAARLGLYVLDVVRLRRLLMSQQIGKADVVIFDRYLYDQIANIYSPSPVVRTYIRLLLKQIPRPDLAFILDASPAEAFARKPEYPLEFMYQNRRAFLRLREFYPQLITISGAGVEDVKSKISMHVLQSRLAKGKNESKAEATAEGAVVRPQNSCRAQNEPTASL